MPYPAIQANISHVDCMFAEKLSFKPGQRVASLQPINNNLNVPASIHNAWLQHLKRLYYPCLFPVRDCVASCLRRSLWIWDLILTHEMLAAHRMQDLVSHPCGVIEAPIKSVAELPLHCCSRICRVHSLCSVMLFLLLVRYIV